MQKWKEKNIFPYFRWGMEWESQLLGCLIGSIWVATLGNIITVTTCNQNVASIMSTTASYHLGELPYEECWLLFAQQAFTNVNSVIHQDMEIIGREIVSKWKGLPLAVKTLGGLLGSKRDNNAYNEVLNNEI